MSELEHLAAENRRLVESGEALARRLEEKNQDFERLIYTVSHDLTSPLITIMGFLSMVERSAAAGDVDQVREDIARITGASQHMKQLLDELLELSRIGRVVHPPRQVALRELVRKAVDLVALPEEPAIDFEIADDLPDVVADPVRLLQVFQHLIGNAVEFLGDAEQPKITIGVRSQVEPVIYVRDNGVGIDAADLDRIFGLFVKVDRNSPGSGIGLALVRRILELHEGRLWAESDGMGQGAAFCLVLPPAVASGD